MSDVSRVFKFVFIQVSNFVSMIFILEHCFFHLPDLSRVFEFVIVRVFSLVSMIFILKYYFFHLIPYL